MDIDLNALPIPDFGLACPRCQYPLKGLPSHRCPECGTEVDIPALVRPWTRLRAPRFTGAETPLPDFGLTCASCGAPLAGATACACPACSAPFDPAALRPESDWFILDASLCGPLSIPAVQTILASEKVPYIPVHERTFNQIIGGHSIIFDRLRVPTEFYFELRWLLRRTVAEMTATRHATARQRWQCPKCGEKNPGHFEICWNCQESRDSDKD